MLGTLPPVMVSSVEDAGCCLLSVAWNIAPGFPGADRPEDHDRADEIRAGLVATCQAVGKAARAWAITHGAGTEADYLPLLRLADAANEIDALLRLITGMLVPDTARDRRRWAEVDDLRARVRELSGQVTAFLPAAVPACC